MGWFFHQGVMVRSRCYVYAVFRHPQAIGENQQLACSSYIYTVIIVSSEYLVHRSELNPFSKYILCIDLTYLKEFKYSFS
jgi:hypothetical protein